MAGSRIEEEQPSISNAVDSSLLHSSATKNPGFNTPQRVFFAKTAHNFYNLAKGYWRPTKKSKKALIEREIQKSINILQAYGEYNSFKQYQQAKVRSRLSSRQGARSQVAVGSAEAPAI